jgi:hypothetical protein
MVTPAALESVLNSLLPSSAPLKDRKEIPYVVAVSRVVHYPCPELTPGEEDEDVFGQDFKGYFNVAVEILLTNLHPMVALGIMDLLRLTSRMRHDKDVWCDTYRGGIRHYLEQFS